MTNNSESVIVTSMGMFIIDDNIYPPSWNRKNDTDIIGGGGPYAIVGATMIAGRENGHRVSGIIDKGSDFPKKVEEQLNSWQSGVIFRENPERLTTRGVNTYDENHVRHFSYKNPKKRIEVVDILQSDKLSTSRCFHLICSIERCESIIDDLNSKLDHTPVYIYEPLPDDCISTNFDRLKLLLPKIDIFTPNLDEAQALLGRSGSLPSTSEKLKEVASHFMPYLKLKNSGIILRCGPLGCFINTIDDYNVLLPAYHSDQTKVVDVTGGGNSFCGGCIAGFYLSGGNWLVAGVSGNLVSGCVIEKLGMPLRQSETNKWNGSTVSERLDTYLKNNPQIIEVQNEQLLQGLNVLKQV
ncbi:hypothetical protein G9P44_003262 [Scheffersomyces stipitis]|nr:hypothetical protein G9P44_003262 [Scheffersomyces stipitis]